MKISERVQSLAELQTLQVAARCQQLLASAGAFGEANCVRMLYATSENNIIETMRRIKETLSQLKIKY